MHTAELRNVPVVLAAVLALACAARAQDPKPKPLPPDLPAPSRPAPDAENVPKDPASALVPGKLPDDASPEAQKAWRALLAASVPGGGAQKAITSFSARVDARFTGDTVNEVKGAYAYLAPGFVRIRADRENVERLRGPQGDFVIDAKGAHPLDRADKENQQDLRQVDDFVAMAKNFVALTSPSALRVATLALLPAPPAGLEGKVAERAKELRWLDVQSPDFRLARVAATSAGAAPMYRVRLGLDPATSLPALALLDESRAGAPAAPLAPTTLFLVLESWAPADGYALPRHLSVYEIDAASIEAGRKNPLAYRFRPDPSSDVYLKQPKLNDPELKPESFLAPTR